MTGGPSSAYRLRGLPGAESFAAAWDAALGMPAWKVTSPPRDFLGETLGTVRLVTFRGRYRGSWYNAPNGSLVTHEFGRRSLTV